MRHHSVSTCPEAHTYIRSRLRHSGGGQVCRGMLVARAGFVRRHKVAVASNTALVLAAGAVIGYAVAADGYQAHEAQLNDGGIWVVHGDRGIYGRINKPINQLDAIVFAEGGSDRLLDVVQDGAAVAAIDRKAGTAQIIDPLTSKLEASGKISLP